MNIHFRACVQCSPPARTRKHFPRYVGAYSHEHLQECGSSSRLQLPAETLNRWHVWWLLCGRLQTRLSANQSIYAATSSTARDFQWFAAHASAAEAAWQALLRMWHSDIAVLRRRSRRDRRWCHSTTQVCCTVSPWNQRPSQGCQPRHTCCHVSAPTRVCNQPVKKAAARISKNFK